MGTTFPLYLDYLYGNISDTWNFPIFLAVSSRVSNSSAVGNFLHLQRPMENLLYIRIICFCRNYPLEVKFYNIVLLRDCNGWSYFIFIFKLWVRMVTIRPEGVLIKNNHDKDWWSEAMVTSAEFKYLLHLSAQTTAKTWEVFVCIVNECTGIKNHDCITITLTSLLQNL